jgi:5'(3')-deoxyribonucleotidase
MARPRDPYPNGADPHIARADKGYRKAKKGTQPPTQKFPIYVISRQGLTVYDPFTDKYKFLLRSTNFAKECKKLTQPR